MQNWDQFTVIIGTAVLNAAVSWGAFRIQLAWLRSESERAHKRIDAIEDRERSRLLRAADAP